MAIFDKDSFRKITSLEHLDEALVVMGIRGWLVLAFCALIVFVSIGWSFLGKIPVEVNGKAIVLDVETLDLIQSPISGAVQEVKISEGSIVKAGDVLFVINNQNVAAKEDGEINELFVSPGDLVVSYQKLAAFQANWQPKDEEILAFIPYALSDLIKPGMDAQVSVNVFSNVDYGMIKAKIRYVSYYPIDPDSPLLKKIPSKSLRQYFAGGEPVVLVILDPLLNPDFPSGFQWTSKKGPGVKILPGTLGFARVIIKEVPPISFILPTKH
jgi:hypothetical protein